MNAEDLSREELVKQIRNAHVAEHKIHLQFGNCRIEAASDHPEVIRELKGYYAAFIRDVDRADIVITVHEEPPPDFSVPFILKEPDPGKIKVKEEYIDLPDGRVVRKRLTGMVFIFGDGQHVAVGPCLANMNQIVNFINNRYIEWELCRGCLLGHAAGIKWNGRGLALAGFSGAGKSTLALHIMRQGAVFVSNDRLMTQQRDGRLTMYGVAKLPRINPGTILNNPNLIGIMTDEEQERFSKMPAAELWALEHKFDAPIEACFGPDRFDLDAPMDALAILNWKHGAGELKVREVNLENRRDLLPAFMKSTGLFFLPQNGCEMPAPTEANYIKMLSAGRILEFSGGVDFERAAEICTSFLDSGTLP